MDSKIEESKLTCDDVIKAFINDLKKYQHDLQMIDLVFHVELTKFSNNFENFHSIFPSISKISNVTALILDALEDYVETSEDEEKPRVSSCFEGDFSNLSKQSFYSLRRLLKMKIRSKESKNTAYKFSSFVKKIPALLHAKCKFVHAFPIYPLKLTTETCNAPSFEQIRFSSSSQIQCVRKICRSYHVC